MNMGNGTLDRGLDTQHAGVVVETDEGRLIFFIQSSKSQFTVRVQIISSTVNPLRKEVKDRDLPVFLENF